MQQHTPITSSWNLDSDEIASVTSEDLHDSRPNRWTGAKSSWRHYTAQERQLWRSMQQLQGQDLAVHLYDVFSLRSCRDRETLQGLTVKTSAGDEVVWAPPKMWTAWPLKEDKVPQQSLIDRQRDEDDKFTLRKPEVRFPRSELQEELGATILRMAKQRFTKRKWALDDDNDNESAGATAEQVYTEDSGASSTSPERFSSQRAAASTDGEGDDRMQLDYDDLAHNTQDQGVATPSAKRRRRRRAPTRTYRPTVSADDDLSYRLLDPCVGHILAKLDQALTILHNARVAGVSHLSDSSTGSDSDSQTAAAGAGATRKRRRSHRRSSRSADRDASDSMSSSAGLAVVVGGGDAGQQRKRGRPRKVHVPRDGETLEEMHMRVARESHRRLPFKRDADRDRAFEEWLRRDGDGSASPPAEPDDDDDDAVAEEKQEERACDDEDGYGTADSAPAAPPLGAGAGANVNRKLRRWGLRDWSDVVGAAALAGFPEAAVRRTARRCARLFGEGMVLRRLDQVPASRGKDTAIIDVEYRPERIAPFTCSSSFSDGGGADGVLTDDDSDDELAPTLQQRRLASRASTTPSSPRGRRSRSRSTAVGAGGGGGGGVASRSRSRSLSAAGLLFFCPVGACERAATGFSRRLNLRRHMTLVHPGRTASAADENVRTSSTNNKMEDKDNNDDDDADSDDEVLGAVHVDGFLRPIAAGRGWRASDHRQRLRRSRAGARGRHGQRDRDGGRSRADKVDADGDDDGRWQGDHETGSDGGDEAD